MVSSPAQGSGVKLIEWGEHPMAPAIFWVQNRSVKQSILTKSKVNQPDIAHVVAEPNLTRVHGFHNPA
jgi:hypothetical protein